MAEENSLSQPNVSSSNRAPIVAGPAIPVEAEDDDVVGADPTGAARGIFETRAIEGRGPGDVAEVENHGLAKAENKKDYATRMKDFFDHHLMGKPAPDWWKDGVPFLKMDDHLKTRK